MLFHVIAKHTYETCPGVQHRPESAEVKEMTAQKNCRCLGV